MNIGKMRHRVEVQRPVYTADTAGQMIETWVKVGDYWADVMPLSGREFLQAEAVEANITTKVRMRYLEGLLVTDRIIYDNRILEINSIINTSERDREIFVLCQETV